MSFQKAVKVDGDYERGYAAAKEQDREMLDWAKQHIATVEVQNATLRAVLEPFAEVAREFVVTLKDDDKNTMTWAVPKVGAFRAALLALGEQPPAPDKSSTDQAEIPDRKE